MELWREITPASVCLRAGRRPFFISRGAMRGSMGYERSGFPEDSLEDPSGSQGLEQAAVPEPSPTEPAAGLPDTSPIGKPEVGADYYWLKDLNQVTKFDERNIGHDELFLVEETQSAAKLLSKMDLNANITGVKYTGGMGEREERARIRKENRMLVDLGAAQPKVVELPRGKVQRIRRRGQNTTDVGGGIPRMTSNHLGTPHKLYQLELERNVGGSGDSPRTSDVSGMPITSEIHTPDLDDSVVDFIKPIEVPPGIQSSSAGRSRPKKKVSFAASSFDPKGCAASQDKKKAVIDILDDSLVDFVKPRQEINNK